MSGARRDIAAIRLAGRPDVLFVDGAASEVRLGDRVTVETSNRSLDGRIVINPDQLTGDFGVLETGLGGSLERRDERLVVTLGENRIPLATRQIGAAIRREVSSAGESSLHDLYREFESPGPRLGRSSPAL